jgi:hypothetical protein
MRELIAIILCMAIGHSIAVPCGPFVEALRDVEQSDAVTSKFINGIERRINFVKKTSTAIRRINTRDNSSNFLLKKAATSVRRSRHPVRNR